MSQNVILDLSNATARSRGQAIRHQHPNLSSDVGKSRRKAARQRRTELKKQGSAERKICTEQSQETPLSRMRNPSTSIAKGNVENRDSHHGHDVESQIGDLAFTIFPRSQNKTNKRAFGQASRYMNANARKQSQKDTKGAVGMNSEDLPVNGLGCGLKSLITEPVDEDEEIAESTALILMDIANRAGPSVSLEPTADIYLPEFEERNFEELRATDSIESVRAGQPSHDKYCLDPLCEYFTKGFAYKARRDCHVLSHYNCTMICEFCPKTAPRGVSFKSVEALRYHVMFMHFCEEDGSTSACMTCNRSSLDPERFFHHIEGCVLRWMEKRATDA